MAAKIMIQPVESRTFMNPAEGQRTVSFTGRFRVTGGGFAGSVVVSSAGCRVAEAKLPPGRGHMRGKQRSKMRGLAVTCAGGSLSWGVLVNLLRSQVLAKREPIVIDYCIYIY